MVNPEFTGQLGDWLADRVPRLAELAHRRFPQVPKEDFYQELWLRAHSHHLKLAKFLKDGNDGYAWRDLNKAVTRLGKEDDRYRRAVKAAREGYRTVDEQFYSTGMLAMVLPALIEAEFNVAEAVANASQQTDAAGVHISGDDPDSQGNYAAILVDVCTAFHGLRKGDQNIIAAYYGAGDEDTEQGRWDRHGLASSMGITYEAFKQRAYYALRKLQDELGGEDPWRRQDREAA
jgi:hypothetical protein